MQYRESSDSEDFRDKTKFPALPQDEDGLEMVLGLLEMKTEEIKIQYFSFSRGFKNNFLQREQKGDTTFQTLYCSAVDLFKFKDNDKEKMLQDCDSNDLLEKVFFQQSYTNCDLLKVLVNECGTDEDRTEAKQYTEAFNDYVKQRMFECDPDLEAGNLPGHDEVMFVLDRDHEGFKLGDAGKFRLVLSKMLGIDYLRIKIRKVKPGCVIIIIFLFQQSIS